MADAPPRPAADDRAIVDLVPIVQKIINSRIKNSHVVDDLVQETIARVIAARSRIAGESLAPYAAVTARNLVASFARRNDVARSKSHLLADVDLTEPPGEGLLREEETSIVAAALARLPAAEQDLLMAHEVHNQGTRTLARSRDSTPGAVAAQLSRARAKLRVEYLLVQEQVEPSSDRCRPVLRALSAGDRRRQQELGAGAHLLECECCAHIAAALLDRRDTTFGEGDVRVPISKDADVVTARQKGRETAAQLGFSATEGTLIATAISEIARNIVKFAERGELLITTVVEAERQGVTIVARDVGPGIPDVHEAMQDGYSTYHGLGLGLPGAKRLMDEFEVVTEVGQGTTVTMTKWQGPTPRNADRNTTKTRR